MTTFPGESLAILLAELLRVDPPSRRDALAAGDEGGRSPRAWVTLDRGSEGERRSRAALAVGKFAAKQRPST